MKSTLSALAICSLVVLPPSLATAQEKIAPTRTYGNDRNYGKEYGATYSNKSRMAPERDFGLPAAARPKAMPEQQDGLVKGTPAPAAHPIPNDTATTAPRGGTGVNADAFGLPQLAPNHDLVPPAAPSASTADFFAHTTDFGAPRTDDDAETSETPLYTTRNPAVGTGTSQLEGGAVPGTAGSNAFGSDAFGTKPRGEKN